MGFYNVGNLHTFGCDAYVHIPKKLRRKLNDKAEKLTFVGYSEESKAFRLLNTKTNRIKISRDVVFLDKGNEVKLTHTEYNEVMPPSINNQENSEEIRNITEDQRKHYQKKNLAQMRISLPTRQLLTTDNNQEKMKQGLNHEEMKTSNRGVPRDRYQASLNMVTDEENEPRIVKETLTVPNKDKWKEASHNFSRSKGYRYCKTFQRKSSIFKREVI